MKKRVVLILSVVVVTAGLVGGVWWYIRRNTGWRLLARTQLAIRAGNLQEGLDLAGRYAAKYPDDWQGHYWRSLAFARLGRYDEARKLLDSVLSEAAAGRMTPDQTDVRLLLAETYSHPARRSLSVPDVGRQPQALRSAIDQLTTANAELGKIAASEPKRALDVKESTGMNWLSIATASRSLSQEYDRLAELAKTAKGPAQEQEEQAKAKAASDDAVQAGAKAVECLREVVLAEPSRQQAAQVLVELCAYRGDRKGLEEIRRVMLAMEDPPPGPTATLILDLAVSAGEPGGDPNAASQRLRHACQALDRILARHPKATEAKAAKAELSLRMGDVSAADRLCNEVLADDARNRMARFIRAKVMERQGKLPDAERELFSLKTDFPNWTDVHIAHAWAAHLLGKREMAREAMRHIVTRINPAQPVALRYLAESLLREGFPEQAFTEAKRYYDAAPDDTAAISLLVDLAKRTDQTALANEVLQKTLKEYGNRPELLLAVAEGYTLLGDKERAAKGLLDLTSIKPDTKTATLAVARAMRLAGRSAEAEKLLTEHLARGPAVAQPEVNLELGLLYAAAGRTYQAAEQLRKAAQDDRQGRPAKLALARALFEVGELEECEGVLAELSSSDPEVAFLRLRVQLRRGQAPAEADALLQTATAGQTGFPVAMAYLAGGQPQKCVDACLSGLKKTPKEPDLLLLLGRAYLELGQRDKCIEQWKLALAAEPAQLSIYRDLAQVLGGTADAGKVDAELAAVPGARPELVGLACAGLLERQGKYAEAAERYRRVAESLAPTEDRCRQARMGRARSLALTGRVDEALAELDAVRAEGAWAREVAIRKISLLIEAGRTPQAQAALEGACQDVLKQQDAIWLSRMIPLCLGAQQVERGLALCGDLDRLWPNDPRPDVLRASLLAGSGRTREAAAALGKAIEKQPGNLATHILLARTLEAEQDPAACLKALDRLADLGDTGQMESLYQRGLLLASWGLNAQAAECFEQLASRPHAGSPGLRLRLGRALALIGQRDRAKAVLGQIPSYAGERIAAQQFLADTEQDLDAKLKILEELGKAAPDNVGVLVQHLSVLADAGRPADVVKVFEAWSQKGGEERPVAGGPSYLALRAMLDTGQRSKAEQLAARVYERTGDARWRTLAGLLMLDQRPKAALGLLPKPADARLEDAITGVCAACQTGDLDAAGQWAKVVAQIDERGRLASSPRPVPPAIKLLAAMATGQSEKARLEFSAMKNSRTLQAVVATELMSHYSGDPKPASEAATLLKAMLAVDVGLPSLGSGWAMDLLKSRPACQWAADVTVRGSPDTSIRRQVLDLLQPKGCALGRMIEATILMEERKYPQAANAFSEAARACPDAMEIVVQQAMALESAGELAEAADLYRRAWNVARNPVAGNNAAYLISRLHPKDAARLAEAQAIIDDVVKLVSGMASFQDTAGWIAHLRGDEERARRELRQAVKGLTRSPEVHYHVGVVEIASGNKLLARWHLDTAVRLGDDLKAGGRNTKAQDDAVAAARASLAAIGQGAP